MKAYFHCFSVLGCEGGPACASSLGSCIKAYLMGLGSRFYSLCFIDLNFHLGLFSVRYLANLCQIYLWASRISVDYFAQMDQISGFAGHFWPC